MTLPLPDWIRTTRLPGYRSIYDLCPQETRLFGTEDLYGDWNGRTLLLLKHFSDSEFVLKRIRDGDPRPYRHEPTLRVNRMLERLANQLAASPDPQSCDILYGSALAGLLPERRFGSNVPSRNDALDFAASVLEFVVSHMPRLQVIVAMGEEAREAVARASDSSIERKPSEDNAVKVVQVDVAGRTLQVLCARNPARQTSYRDMELLGKTVRNMLDPRSKADQSPPGQH